MSLKICVIGAGSSYTPELIANLVEPTGALDVGQVDLMDPNREKVEGIARVSARLAQEAGVPIRVRPVTNREEAITGADFIILQIRVGGLAARVRDEKIPMGLGMIGNETTGAGGFACALRTVTAALEIARDIERLAPEAVLLNLANPAGIVTEALLNHTRVRTLGFCNIPTNTAYALARFFGAAPETVQLDYIGLNHLGWTRRVFIDGQERLQAAILGTHTREEPLYKSGLVDPLMDPAWLRELGMLPAWYVRYFYFPDLVLAEDQREQRTKGEDDMSAERKLAEIYARDGYNPEAQKILNGKGGAQYYVPVLQAVDSIVHDRGDVIVADVTNGRALPDLPAESCVELPARLWKDRFEPVDAGPLPLKIRGLVQAVKAYEQLTIQAALTGDHGTAIAALMANPLVGSYTKARDFFDCILKNEQDYLPQFYQA